MDPAPELPPPLPRAGTESGLVVLTTPTDVAQGREAVRRFFRAVLKESPEELAEEVSPTAQARLTSGAIVPIVAFWIRRFSELDYTSLAGGALFRERDVQTFRGSDKEELRGARLPLHASADGVVIRVKMRVTRSGKTRMFGDELVFLLEPVDGSYRINSVVEDFDLP